MLHKLITDYLLSNISLNYSKYYLGTELYQYFCSNYNLNWGTKLQIWYPLYTFCMQKYRYGAFRRFPQDTDPNIWAKVIKQEIKPSKSATNPVSHWFHKILIILAYLLLFFTILHL